MSIKNKPIGWWYHKIICEFGYWIEKKWNSLYGMDLYYKHLHKMCDKYKINLYGKPINN